ncbi:MAG: hypothetical protein LBJ44_07220 [Propionibacteriaceae bacterium]|jgi:hypothetical protein|nr:hypothetical protein [Propionibacteriaceae bacterium]
MEPSISSSATSSRSGPSIRRSGLERPSWAGRIGLWAIACVLAVGLTGCSASRHLSGVWELGAGRGLIQRGLLEDTAAYAVAGLTSLKIDGDRVEVTLEGIDGRTETVTDRFKLKIDDGRLALLTVDDEIVMAYEGVVFAGQYWFNNDALVLALDDGVHLIFLPS